MAVSNIGNVSPKIIRTTESSDPLAQNKGKLAKVDDGLSLLENSKNLEKITIDSEKVLAKITPDSQKGPVKITTPDSAVVNTDKIISNAGLGEQKEELKTAMKDYGVAINAENIKTAAEYSKQLPEWAKDNMELIAVMIARKLPIKMHGLAADYLAGKLKFSELFANMDKEMAKSMKAAWGNGQMLDILKKMIEEGMKENKEGFLKLATMLDKLTAELGFQEIASRLPNMSDEGQIYFQWPLFWNGQDLPDTMEGEAFVPDKKNAAQGFSLRLMVNPPSLGQMEVTLSSHKRKIWITFGVKEESIEPVKSIFKVITERLIVAGDFDSVQITAKTLGPARIFFVVSKEKAIQMPTNNKVGIDLKA